MRIEFENEVKHTANGIFMASALMEKVKVQNLHEYTERLKKDTVQRFRQQYNLGDLGSDLRIEAFRCLYWAFKMDPTKIRPSSEALARRVLSGSSLPTINTIVDSNNAMSLKHLLPIGIYDADLIEGNLRVRLAKMGEPIAKIGGKIEVLNNKELVVSDAKQIVGLGYASSDCDITKVTQATQRLAILIYCAPEISRQASETCLEELVTHITRYSGGMCVDRMVYGQE